MAKKNNPPKKKTTPGSEEGIPQETKKDTGIAKWILGIGALLLLLFAVLGALAISKEQERRRQRDDHRPGENPNYTNPTGPPETSFDLQATGEGSKLLTHFIGPRKYVTTILANVQMAAWPNGGGAVYLEVQQTFAGPWSRVAGPICTKAGGAQDISATVAREITGMRFRGKPAQLWECPQISPSELFNGGKIRRVTGQFFSV